MDGIIIIIVCKKKKNKIRLSCIEIMKLNEDNWIHWHQVIYMTSAQSLPIGIFEGAKKENFMLAELQIIV